MMDIDNIEILNLNKYDFFEEVKKNINKHLFYRGLSVTDLNIKISFCNNQLIIDFIKINEKIEIDVFTVFYSKNKHKYFLESLDNFKCFSYIDYNKDVKSFGDEISMWLNDFILKLIKLQNIK